MSLGINGINENSIDDKKMTLKGLERRILLVRISCHLFGAKGFLKT